MPNMTPFPIGKQFREMESMPTLRQAVLGLAVLGFGFASAALTPPPAWAEGIGPRVGSPTLTYSPDEDEKKAESRPENFTASRFVWVSNLPTGNHLYMSSSAVPGSIIVLANNLPTGLGLRFDYSYSIIVEEEQPASTFRGWARSSILDELEKEDPLDDDEARSFQEWQESKKARDSVREWLGDDAFDSLQDQFGYGGDGGSDISGAIDWITRF